MKCRLWSQTQDLQIFKNFNMSQRILTNFSAALHTQFNYNLTKPVCTFKYSSVICEVPISVCRLFDTSGQTIAYKQTPRQAKYIYIDRIKENMILLYPALGVCNCPFVSHKHQNSKNQLGPNFVAWTSHDP